MNEQRSHTMISSRVATLRSIADEVQKNFCVPYAQNIDDAADDIQRMAEALLEILQYDQNPQAQHVARRGLGDFLTDTSVTGSK